MGSKSLYDVDLYKWCQEQAYLLRSGRFDHIDTNNIIEEIEDMGKSQKRALTSRLEILLAHLLKWKHQPALSGKSWRFTIEEQRYRIAEIIEDSPSLKNSVAEVINRAYGHAKRLAARETGMDASVFPQECPWAFSQMMDDGFWPA